jgi:AcrR family transcriptional regulator
MASHSAVALRRIPQQARGQRRVNGFLRAAASVFTEAGYERATMSAIAERASSCIGSLYQFFPNKQSVVEALRDQFIKDIEQSWIGLERRAAGLKAEALASQLVNLQIDIINNHPVMLALMDVPPTACTPARREMIRARIAAVLIAHKPRIQKAAALRIASVVQEISKALMTMYANSDLDTKPAMIEEFRAALTGYLVPRLKQ